MRRTDLLKASLALAAGAALTLATTPASAAQAAASHPSTSASGGSCTGFNNTAVAIPDNGPIVTSTITIAGCSRAPSPTSRVSVNITHRHGGDLAINLVAPDGSVYHLKSSTPRSSSTDVITWYSTNLSSEAPNGVWTLQVRDEFATNTGTLNNWGLSL